MALIDLADLTPEERQSLANRVDWAWTLELNGETNPVVTKPVRIVSKRAGESWPGIFPDAKGRPAFDRMVTREGKGAVSVVWGFDKKGRIIIVLLHEARPAADIAPCFADCTITLGGYTHMVFAHPPMGFSTDVKAVEGTVGSFLTQRTAAQEIRQELGAKTILRYTTPDGAVIYPNPSCMANFSDLIYVQVRLSDFGPPKLDGDEIVIGHQFYTLNQVGDGIASGRIGNAVISQGVGGMALARFWALVTRDPKGWRKRHPME